MDKFTTNDKDRSTFALKKIKQIDVDKRKGIGTKYASLPVLIMTNGLGQTLAFLKHKSKSDEAKEKMYSSIVDWLKECGYITKEEVFEELCEMNSIDYVKAESEVLKFSEWLKRYARVYDEDDKV